MGWYPSKQMWTGKHDTICQWWFLFAVHDVQSQQIKGGWSTLPFPKITSRKFLITTVWVYHPYYHFSWAVLIPTWAMWAGLKTQFHISKSSAVPWKMHKQDAIQAPWHWTLWGMGKSCCEKYAQQKPCLGKHTHIHIYIYIMYICIQFIYIYVYYMMQLVSLLVSCQIVHVHYRIIELRHMQHDCMY